MLRMLNGRVRFFPVSPRRPNPSAMPASTAVLTCCRRRRSGPAGSGGCSATCPCSSTSLDLLTPLAEKMVPQAGGAPSDNPDIPVRLHLPGAVHRPRHHFRPGLEPAAPERPGRAAQLPHPALRPRLGLRPRPRRPAVPVRRSDGCGWARACRARPRGPAAGPDLPRNDPRNVDGQPNFGGRALIGDPRNDENLIVSQLHATMLQVPQRRGRPRRRRHHLGDRQPLQGGPAASRAGTTSGSSCTTSCPKIVGEAVVDDILRPETYTVVKNGRSEQVAITRPEAAVLPAPCRRLHSGRVLRRRLPVRSLHGPRPLPHQHVPAATRSASGRSPSSDRRSRRTTTCPTSTASAASPTTGPSSGSSVLRHARLQ